jgi:MFS family permease
VAIERRSAAPLIRLGIFRIRTIVSANLVLLLVASGMFSMFFFASIYTQEILGYSPLKAGLAFLPVTAGIMGGAAIAQPLISRIGVRAVATAGVAIATVGMIVMTGVSVHGSYVGDLLAGLIPLSLGMGLVFVPITLLATSNVDDEDAGLASGLFNTAQQVGGALGLAILSTLAADHTAGVAGDRATALVSGYQVAFTGGAVMLGAAAILLVVLLRRRHLEGFDPEAAPAVVPA